MKVVLIGTGNVANVLGRKIRAAGNEILEVVGRNHESASKLAALLGASPVSSVNVISSVADIYIIAVSDHAIQRLTDELRLHDKIVVHTAAAQPKNILKHCSSHYGVIYPLQTLKKETGANADIPILITGNNEDTRKKLYSFCNQWSNQVLFVSDEERLKLHLAAVFVNNFTNHLLAIAQKYCGDNQLDFNYLLPLIEQTFTQIRDGDAVSLQTGPARRNDVGTIQKHRQLLANDSKKLQLYNVLTESIRDFYNG